jgi:peptidoglycan/LPS O-acetylase OafA/YrhL
MCLIVAFHSELPLSGAFASVDVFFVISGFVITAMILRGLERADGVAFVEFYSARARRLLPALAVMLVVVAFVSILLLSPLGTQQRAARTGAAGSLYVANAQLYRGGIGYFDPPSDSNPLVHIWTLGVEEQFYLVFPALILLGWRLGRRKREPHARRSLSILLGACAAVSFVLSVVLTHVDERFAFYSSPTRAWEFAFGALLAVVAPLLPRYSRRVASAAATFGAVLIAVAMVALTDRTPFPGFAALLPVVGATAVIGAGTVATTWASRFLSTGPLVWMGDRSYGWYLWHWPAIVFARALWPNADWLAPIAGAFAIIPAWASYRYIENPVRANHRLTGRRVLPLVASCALVPALAFGVLWALTRPSLLPARLENVAKQFQIHADQARGCSNSAPVRAPVARCTWAGDDASDSVYLVGDSNAGQFTEGVARAATRAGYSFTVATRTACPFADLTVRYDTPFDADGCRRYVLGSVAGFVRLRPALVVIASSASEYIEQGEHIALEAPNGKIARTPVEKARAWRDGTASVVDMLTKAGIPTIVVSTVPHIKDFDLELCPAVKLYFSPDSCGDQATRSRVDAFRHRASVAERDAVTGVRLASTLDVADEICSPTLCRTNDGRRWIYRDGAHITVGTALRLADTFTAAIERATRR